MKKTLSLILAFLLVLIPTANVYALSIQDLEAEENISKYINENPNIIKSTIINGEEYNYINIEDLPEEMRVGVTEVILIFVAEYLVGEIIDGVFISTIGKTPGEWLGDALNWVGSGVKKLFCNESSVDYGTNENGCVKFTPNGNWHCPN